MHACKNTAQLGNSCKLWCAEFLSGFITQGCWLESCDVSWVPRGRAHSPVSTSPDQSPRSPRVSWWQVPSFWLGQHVSSVISLGQMMSESIVFTLLHYLITMSSQVWSRGPTTNSKNITREIPTKRQVPPVCRDREASCTLCYTETAQTLEQNTFPQSMGFHAESSPKLRRLPNHRPNF